MTGMIEKVARALHKEDGALAEFERSPNYWIGLARAAIEAMEPTEAMLIAGAVALSGPLTSSSSVWQAMIQAALEGTET